MANLMQAAHLQRYSEMPNGWRYDPSWGSPVAGHAPICNGKSMIKGGRKGLLKVPTLNSQPIVDSCHKAETPQEPARIELTSEETKEAAKLINDLARAKFKQKLLQDLAVDMMVCKIEGWSIKEYVSDLKTLIDETSYYILHN